MAVRGISDVRISRPAHIDALAKNGVQFSSGYSAYSVCGPSRAEWSKGFIEPAYLGVDDTKGHLRRIIDSYYEHRNTFTQKRDHIHLP
jgi:hypothetical protein